MRPSSINSKQNREDKTFWRRAGDLQDQLPHLTLQEIYHMLKSGELS